MNVAIVLMKYNPFGGYERQATLLVRALALRGDRVTVFAGKWTGEAADNVTFRKVPVVRFSSWLKVLSFAISSKRMIESDPAGFDLVVAFDRTLVMDIYRAGNACHREWQAFRREFGGLGGRLSMVFNPLHSVINSIEGRIFSAIQQAGGTVVVLSEVGMRQIRRHYAIDEERFRVIPPAVALGRIGPIPAKADREAARAALGLAPDSLVLLHVGSGFGIKGLKSTIGAVSVLAGRGVDAVLLVAGRDRRGTARMCRLARELGVDGRVRFLGGVDDVAPLYAASDVFVLPSLFETFGVAVVEALAAGLPVVVGRGAGAAGFVEREGAGRAIAVPSDPGELATVIEEVCSFEEQMRQSGALADERTRRREAALKCSEAVVMERFLSVIDEAAAGRGRGSRRVG